MVYCGKPSTGCKVCKNRRIKCDETRPHCLNCKKTKRTCPGFPDRVDLIFRRETPGRRRKTRKTRANDGSLDRIIADASIDGIPNNEPAPSKTLLRRSTVNVSQNHEAPIALYEQFKRSNSLPEPGLQSKLDPSIERQATTYFFNSFVSEPGSRNAARGFLEIAALMFDRVKEDSPLLLAIESVAISVLANWPGRKHLANLAAKLYGKALVAAQKAIEDPKQATSDTTLLMILLFSLYESITSLDHSVAAWAKHIDGAVTIVKARGTKQFQNKQSLLLFRAVRTQMLTNATQQNRPIDEFPGPKGWLSDMKDDQSTAFKLIEISIELPNLLSRSRSVLACERSAQNRREAEALLQRAEETQSAYFNWEMHMPPEWAYKSIAHVSGSADDKVEEMEAWPGPMHLYQDVHVASIRNNNRISQMMCSSLVIDALKWLDPEEYVNDQRYHKAKNRVQELVDEICWSVPFHLWGQDLGERVRPDGQNQAAAEAIGGYFLTWPLSIASKMEHIPDLQRRWMQGRLWAVARYYGIEQESILDAIARKAIAKLSVCPTAWAQNAGKRASYQQGRCAL